MIEATGSYQERIVALYEAHKNMIYGYVSRRVRAADVEDVLQEVLQAIVERFQDFQGFSSEKTWVYSVCRFTVYKYYARRKRRSGEVHVDLGEMESPDPGSPLDRMIDSERHREVSHFLSRLRPSDREILRLRFTEDLTFAEIAEVLGLRSDEACRSRCRRALSSMHRSLRERPAFLAESRASG